MADGTTKTCTGCKQDKPHSAYYKAQTTRDGLMGRCKSCDEDRRRAYRKKVREARRPRPPREGKPPVKCKIDACGETAVSRGWCNPHYQRWYTKGDPLAPVRLLIPNNGRCAIDDCPEVPRSRASRFCNTHYFRWYRHGDPEAGRTVRRYDTCQQCSAPTERRKFCSPRCAARHLRGTSATRVCQICQSVFPTKQKTSTCSNGCARELKRRKDRRYCQNAMATNAKYRDGLRRATLRRRALMVGAFVESFSPLEIHERDNWTCGICRTAINPAARWPGRWSATIDHIVPLSQGGTHERSNVQSAHLTCNCSKNDKVPPVGKVPAA